MPRKKKDCIECKQPCSGVSYRCRTCANKHKGATKKALGHKKKYFCACGKELSKKNYTRCYSCNMKLRWSDNNYKETATKAIRDAFEERWSNPERRRKAINVLTKFGGVSKLEKNVLKLAKKFGFVGSTEIDRHVVDLFHEKNSIIIEVYGDFWHCNPSFWTEDEQHPIKNKAAKEIWEHDAIRKKHLEDLGYKVFILWEHEIKQGNTESKIKWIMDSMLPTSINLGQKI